MKRGNHFLLEITTSALCNLDCTYCFEGKKTNKQTLDDKVDVLKKRIKELYNSEWLWKHYNGLAIDFWGGEPTLNNNLIIDIVKEFQDYENLTFHLYTNGYNKKRLDSIIDVVKEPEKFSVQFSYDGRPINDEFRILSTGKQTSETVLENFEYFAKRGISLGIKSTIPLTNMHSLYKTWMEFKDLHEKYKGINQFVSVSYAPTIDYYQALAREEAEKLVPIFREQMLKVAAEEIKFFKKHGYFLCTWFNGKEQKTNCAAGASMHAIDVDGNSYVCHGALYSPNKAKLHSSSIMDDDFINRLMEMSDSYTPSVTRVSEICKDCVATTCTVCPVTSFDTSKNEDHFDKWEDRWVGNMCGFFKAFGEIDRSVQHYLSKTMYSKE